MLLLFIQIAVLCITALPADADQPEKARVLSRGPITFESQWRAQLDLSRDLSDSYIPHSRRRGLLAKYRRKSDTKQAKVKKILEARKQRDQLLARLLRDKAKADKELANPVHPKSGGKLIEANKIRDGIIDALIKDRDRETHELEGDWNKENEELLERTEEIEAIEAYLNGSNGHIWDRKARGAEYDPDYDWENGGEDYSSLSDANKKESKFEKYAKHWQKHALKAMFAISFICMILCCCIACCKKVFGRLCEVCCFHLKEWRDICLNRDPTYRRIRAFADDYGLDIDYDQYKRLKHNYEEGFKKQGHEAIDFSGR